MSTATLERPRTTRGSKSKQKLECSIDLKGFSYGGKGTCNLRASIAADALTADQAQFFLGGSQLSLMLEVAPKSKKDGEGQMVMREVATRKFSGIAEVKSYSVSGEYSFGMTFNAKEYKPSDVLKVAGCAGTITAERVGNASPPKEGEKEDDDEDKD